ncbi:molybdopterin-dependent oxidoreductase, partial [Patescibacteria group bacterium]|nr:molybdopterin-dependent oxidoreductase [Patescibacteria group bacterium]
MKTTCTSHCGGSCLLKVHVKEGVITRIETDDGEEPQLRACLKGRAQRQKVYAPDRLLYPLKRVGDRGEGKFERISWDEALERVASELKRVIDTYGPESVVYDFQGGDITLIHGGAWISQLLGRFGNYTRLWSTPSFMGGSVASLLMYGTLHASNNRDDLVNSKLIIMWGWDPASTVSGTNTNLYLFQAKERGAKIISVDPRYTDSAAILAEQWIPIRPSTDTAMLIAMAYVMIKEKIYDEGFIERYTIGFEQFKDYVSGAEDGVPKTPAWAQEITGVPTALIEGLAREYATTKPAALMPSGAPGRTSHGEEFHRASITLAAMTGNIGIHGGYPAARAWESLLGGYPYDIKFFKERIDHFSRRDDPPSKEVIKRRRTQIHRLELPDFILKGKAGGYHADGKLVFLVSFNYLNQAPNINKTIKAFQMAEFIVVQEQFMTPTAKFADILLPVNTFLERNDITFGWHSAYVGCMPKIIDSIGESKSPLEIAVDLARHMGVSDLVDKRDEEILRGMAAECGITDFEEFRERGYHKIELAEPYVAFREQIEDLENHPFSTPSGKIEIYSERWAELKDPELPPIPKYIEARESWRSSLAKKYPLQFINTHFRKRALSQFDNVPWMRELGGQELQINPRDALARGIGE